MSIGLDDICDKVRARRPIYNLAGERIAVSTHQTSVLRHMCTDGLRHKQIAYDLGEPERVIREVSASLLRLSGCKTPAQLGAWAERQGLL
jgi:DNA-binding NarL/FixJ family response regulator